MNRSHYVVFALAAALLAGCNFPGRPSSATEKPPDKVLAFGSLYADHCAGCHGQHGQGGAAVALDSPVYLSIVNDGELGRAISLGAPKTPMPAFARSAGGSLSDARIGALVKGIRGWAKPGSVSGAPPYVADRAGNAKRGQAAFGTFCSSCHGADGKGSAKAGSVVDPSYLALVSDQYLRTVVIVGRPKLGAPDFRADVPGRPMTDQEVTDVVAWLEGHRTPYPGQPYPAPRKTARKGEQQ